MADMDHLTRRPPARQAALRCLALTTTIWTAAATAGCSRRADRLEWPTGEQVTFEAKVSTVTSAAPSPVPIVMDLLGKVQLRFARDGQVLRGVIWIEDARLADFAGKDIPSAGPLLKEVAQPFGVELVGGVLSAYYDPPESSEAATGLRETVASLLQMGAGKGKDTWKSSEWDATGESVVEYTRESGASAAWSWKRLEFRKIVMALAAASRVDAQSLRPEIIASAGRLTADGHGIVAAERREQTRLPLSPTQNLSVQTQISLKRVAVAVASGDVSAGAFDAARRRSVDAPPPSRSRTNFDDVRTRGRSIDDVIAELEAFESKNPGDVAGGAKAQLFEALVGFIRTEPTTVGLLLRKLRENSKISSTFLDALAMASSGDSIKALGDIAFDESSSVPRRSRAAMSLIRVGRPNPQAFELAKRMVDDKELREHGLLGLGTYIRLWREQNQEALVKQGNAILAKALPAARSANDRATILLAIANSGSAELFALAKKEQSNPDRSVREAAIQAVRLMNLPNVEDDLRSLLDRKELGDVRSALHALGRRTIARTETIKQIRKLAETHDDPDVRREAVLALAHSSDRWPEIPGVLEHIRSSDTNSLVREAAR